MYNKGIVLILYYCLAPIRSVCFLTYSLRIVRLFLSTKENAVKKICYKNIGLQRFKYADVNNFTSNTGLKIACLFDRQIKVVVIYF